MQNSDNIDNIIDRVLFSQDDIEEICQRLGKQLTEDYAGKFPLVIGVLKGAVYFMTDLTRHMNVKMQNDFMDVSSYGDGFESSGKVRLDMTFKLMSKIETFYSLKILLILVIL